MGHTAKARLLEGCALAGGRLLRGGGAGTKGERLVVAAKMLVLSRLLVKSLEEEGDDNDDTAAVVGAAVAVSVEASKKSLGSLRRRLLRGIERVLELADVGVTDRDDVLRALCAYSLATNSGARDVLRHFLHIRERAMAPSFEVDDESERDHERGNTTPRDVLRSLELYTRTLLDVQALVPHRLTEALVGLKRKALLADEALRRSEGLRLDVYERWCGDDIQYFKPYIRHDDLDGQQAKEMLAGWAHKGAESLMRELEKTLERLFDFKAIVDMRTRVLQLWIREGGKAKGFDPSVMLDKLRGAINRHMLQVLNMKVGKLRLVGSEVAAALASWHDGVTDRYRSLWDGDGLDVDLSDGAAGFAQDVIARLYGRNDAVSKAVACYTAWHHVIDDVGAVVDQLRRQRWDNDVDEIEDEETIEQRQQLLSKDDPQTLHDRLDAAVEKAFRELDKQLAREWESREKDAAAANSGRIAMYLLRVLRDIRSRLPELPAVRDFGLALVPSMHEKIVVAVAAEPLDELAGSALARKFVAGRNLWEGSPELPTSPSPGAFRFLRSLCVAMGDGGMDLWSPSAVAVLKKHVAQQLARRWLEALEAHDGAAPPAAQPISDTAAAVDDKEGREGTEDKTGAEPEELVVVKPTAEQRRDVFIQWLFDVSMLRCCIDTGGDELKTLEEAISQKTGIADSAARQRLNKASLEYWKKTSLLFGLLT